MARRLDGKAMAENIKRDLRKRVRALTESGMTVGLATVLVGDDPASMKYVAGKHKDCREVGITSIRIDLPSTASTEEVLSAVRDLNCDPRVTGYIVQLPLPVQVDTDAVLREIDPLKDADGLSPAALGQLVLDVDGGVVLPRPCTPAGVIRLLEGNGISLDGLNVCVVGRGLTIGRTVGLMLTTRGVNATVDLCHTGTVDLAAHVAAADVVIACAGSAGIITPGMLGDRDGKVLVDVGVTRVVDPVTGRTRILGDVDPACHDDPRVAAFTPNPGGVGPMTRVMLLENVVRLAESRASK